MSSPEKMDQMSLLPEELLCHVLSFLPTKEAGLTTVLSKRWRNLLTFVPYLDIDADDSVLLHPEMGKREKEETTPTFTDSVNRVLASLGDSRLVKFSLKWKNCVDSYRANQWIRTVLRCGVMNMDLFIYFERYETYRLPSEIFMSKTLVKLKLGPFLNPIFFLHVPHISLPMLKTLVLESVWFPKGQLQMLLSACPALEELYITNIYFGHGIKTMSSASLKTLRIKSSKLEVLNCLKCSVVVAKDYQLVSLESLVEAHIDLMLVSSLLIRPSSQDIIKRRNKVHKFVRNICNVQKLYLSPDTLQMLGLYCQAMPVFNNLTFLDIESRLDITWKAVPFLLRSCPHLETLVIKGLLHRVTDECGDSCICVCREEKGRSLMSCPVKRLEIRGFEGSTGELEMIKHFLEYFPCLKEMGIYITDGPPQLQPTLLQEMLLRYNDLSGRSPNVKFKVHGSLPCTSQ